MSKTQQEIANPALGAGASEFPYGDESDRERHTHIVGQAQTSDVLRFEDNRTRIDDLKRKLGVR